MDIIHVKRNDFRKLADELHENTDIIAKLTAEHVKALAEQNVPVDTGGLYSSIRVEEKGHANYEVIAGSLAEDIDYAPFVEYGTSNQSAQPYMTPAAEATRPEMIDMVSQELFE